MSSLKPSLLSCVIALLSLPASAVDYSNPFIRDAKVDGLVQTVFFNEKDTSINQTRGAWTGAAWLNAETGYIANFLNVGGSAYRAAKLDIKTSNVGSASLLNAADEPFGKLGQAWIHVKLPQPIYGVNAGIKAGRQLVETGLLSTSVARSIPGSWQGVDASLSFHNFNAEVGWFNRINERDQSGFHDVVNSEGEKIDWVVGTQLSYTFDLGNHRSLEFQYNNGLAKDFVLGQNGNAFFTATLCDSSILTLAGMYYYARQHGNLWIGNTSGFENDAQSGNVYAVLAGSSWTLNAGISYTKAKASVNNQLNGFQALGFYYDQFGENTRGTFNASTSAIFSNFNFDRETAWVVGAEYNFGSVGLEGLSLSYNFLHGSGMRVIGPNGVEHRVRESENDLVLTYNFHQPELKGLTLRLKYAYYTNSEAMFMATDQGEQQIVRAYLVYQFSI